jgi:hypothetical protein
MRTAILLFALTFGIGAACAQDARHSARFSSVRNTMRACG